MTQQRRERLARRLTLGRRVQRQVLCYQVDNRVGSGKAARPVRSPVGGGRVQGQSTMLSALQRRCSVAVCGEQSYVASSQLPIDLTRPSGGSRMQAQLAQEGLGPIIAVHGVPISQPVRYRVRRPTARAPRAAR